MVDEAALLKGLELKREEEDDPDVFEVAEERDDIDSLRDDGP